MNNFQLFFSDQTYLTLHNFGFEFQQLFDLELRFFEIFHSFLVL